MIARALAVALLASLVACGATAGGGSPPQSVVRAWLDAVKRDDPRTAYDLLDDDAKKSISYDEFSRRWKEAKIERAAQARDMNAGVREESQLGERARITLKDGKTTDLIREPGGWRLEAPLMAPVRASTPQDALRLLAAALESRSYEALLRILSDGSRDRARLLVDTFEKGLKAHLGGAIEITGDRASVQWTDGRLRWKIVLVREGGEWRVDDIHQNE